MKHLFNEKHENKAKDANRNQYKIGTITFEIQILLQA